mmetsp:Transcript_34680/g.80957  ORF Transcript_34680/g.80957 Transcript_34680/m.80957 type:complete len:308 (+) Transcript_34680:51-974(+)
MLRRFALFTVTVMAQCCARLAAVLDTWFLRFKAKEGLQPLLQQCRGTCWCGPPQKKEEVEPVLSGEWQEAGVSEVDVTVHTLSGDVVVSHPAATPQTKVATLLKRAAQTLDMPEDRIELWAGTVLLKATSRLGDLVVPDASSPQLEVTLIKFLGPPVEATTTSGSEIEVLDTVPEVGDRCHLDRPYRFRSLGGFATAPNMRYVLTTNEDKRTSASRVMWRLSVRVPVVVFLNFRGMDHVAAVADKWLNSGGWTLEPDMQSTESTGTPNGPYSGPVYSQAFESGSTIDLMGSACWEGTYFVFVQLQDG